MQAVDCAPDLGRDRLADSPRVVMKTGDASCDTGRIVGSQQKTVRRILQALGFQGQMLGGMAGGAGQCRPNGRPAICGLAAGRLDLQTAQHQQHPRGLLSAGFVAAHPVETVGDAAAQTQSALEGGRQKHRARGRRRWRGFVAAQNPGVTNPTAQSAGDGP